MQQTHRAHPVTILANLWRVFYLIVIPVLRGFASALRGGFAAWVSGAWMDILILLLMVALAVWRWRSVTYWYDDEVIELRSGVFYRKRTRVLWEKIVTLSEVEAFYLRPFGAVLFRADTPGGSFKSADFTILLSHSKSQALISRRRAQSDAADVRQYKPTTGSIVALALLTSNSFAGILFIATVISQSGKVLGNQFSDMLIGTFEETTRRLAFNIPPAAAAIGYVLLAGWFLGFCMAFVRYKNFSLEHQQNSLFIKGGIFTSREYCILYDSIIFIDIRQSIATKLLRLYSLYISVVGYGKQKDDISCIIPTQSTKLFEASREKIFPALSPSPRQYGAHAKGIMRFISEPLYPCLGIPVLAWAAQYFFPLWSSFIWLIALMLLVPSLFFLLIRIFDFATGGLAVEGNIYTLRYSYRLYLHTVVIPAEKIVSVELRQGFFQKFGHYCDLIVHTTAEDRAVHRCRNLNKADLAKLFHM